MPAKKTIKMEMKDLSQHPVVLRVTDDINPELLERRRYSPPVCKVFSQKYTILKETDQFTFTVDAAEYHEEYACDFPELAGANRPRPATGAGWMLVLFTTGVPDMSRMMT